MENSLHLCTILCPKAVNRQGWLRQYMSFKSPLSCGDLWGFTGDTDEHFYAGNPIREHIICPGKTSCPKTVTSRLKFKSSRSTRLKRRRFAPRFELVVLLPSTFLCEIVVWSNRAFIYKQTYGDEGFLPDSDDITFRQTEVRILSTLWEWRSVRHTTVSDSQTKTTQSLLPRPPRHNFEWVISALFSFCLQKKIITQKKEKDVGHERSCIGWLCMC